MPHEGFHFGPEDVYPRQRALFNQFESYLLGRLKSLYDRRGRFWNRDFTSLAAYEASVEPNRQHFLAALGGWPWPREALDNPIAWITKPAVIGTATLARAARLPAPAPPAPPEDHHHRQGHGESHGGEHHRPEAIAAVQAGADA